MLNENMVRIEEVNTKINRYIDVSETIWSNHTRNCTVTLIMDLILEKKIPNKSLVNAGTCLVILYNYQSQFFLDNVRFITNICTLFISENESEGKKIIRKYMVVKMFMNHYIKEKMNIKPFKFKLAIALENLN